MNTDNLSTATGSVAAAAILSTVDFQKLGSFDHGEVAKVIFAASLIALGYLTNKGKKA